MRLPAERYGADVTIRVRTRVGTLGREKRRRDDLAKCGLGSPSSALRRYTGPKRRLPRVLVSCHDRSHGRRAVLPGPTAGPVWTGFEGERLAAPV